MPPSEPIPPAKTIEEIVHEVGDYPMDAYEFVQRALSYTVQQTHGKLKDPEASRHVSGQQLCEGIRDYALNSWGMMASAVLGRWNLRKTEDFGRIVFALVDNGHMQKTDDDTLDDFRNVYEFAVAFGRGYRIECKP